MLPLFLALEFLALAAVAALGWRYLARARDARREISRDLHAKAEALDRRCDALAAQIHGLEQQRRLDRLQDLIADARADAWIDADVHRRLRGFVHELRREMAEELAEETA